MRGDSTCLNHCVRSAERIQSWLRKDLELLFSFPIFINKYHCSSIPTMHGTVQANRLFIYEFNPNKLKKNPVYLSTYTNNLKNQECGSHLDPLIIQTHCCMNQKQPYFLEKFFESLHMTSLRITHWHLQRHCVITHQLKNFFQGKMLTKKHRDIIALLPLSKTTDNHTEWYDLIRTQDDQVVKKLPL